RPATLPRAGGLDRRQTEFDGALTARRQHAFHAEPHRAHGSRPWTEGPRITAERNLDGLARQRLGLAREQCRGGKRRLVARTPSPAPRVARSALFKRPPARPPGRLW